jgi:hypothetical protein
LLIFIVLARLEGESLAEVMEHVRTMLRSPVHLVRAVLLVSSIVLVAAGVFKTYDGAFILLVTVMVALVGCTPGSTTPRRVAFASSTSLLFVLCLSYAVRHRRSTALRGSELKDRTIVTLIGIFLVPFAALDWTRLGESVSNVLRGAYTTKRTRILRIVQVATFMLNTLGCALWLNAADREAPHSIQSLMAAAWACGFAALGVTFLGVGRGPKFTFLFVLTYVQQSVLFDSINVRFGLVEHSCQTKAGQAIAHTALWFSIVVLGMLTTDDKATWE